MHEIDLGRLPVKIREQVEELARVSEITIEQAYFELATAKHVVEALNRHKRSKRRAMFKVIEGSGGAARGPEKALQ